MSIAYVSGSSTSSGTGAGATTATVTVPAPSGIVAGNLLLATVYYGEAPAASVTPSSPGWTVIGIQQSVNYINGGVMWTAWKVATSSEPTSYVFSTAASGAVVVYDYVAASIEQYSGVLTTAPIDSSAFSFSTSTTTAITAPSVTATTAGMQVTSFGGYDGSGITAPAGFSARQNPWISGIVAELDADHALTAPGDTGTTVATQATAGYWVASTIVLAPAAVSPTGYGSSAYGTAPYGDPGGSTPTLSGSGALSAGVAPKPAVTVALSGSGALSAATTPKPAPSVSLSGSGALTSTATPKPAVAAALTGSGALTASGTPIIPGSASDTFTGSSGAPWSSQWTTAAGTSGTATIAATGTSGQIVLAAAHPTDARQDLTAVPCPAILDTYVDVQALSIGSYVAVGWGDLSGSDARSGNGYETVLQFNGASSKISIGQFIGGAETKPATDVILTTASSTWYTLHLQYDGTNLRAKLYAQGAAEPGAWTITGAMPTPASLPTTGYVSLGTFQSNSTSRTTGYDNLLVSTPTTVAYSGSPALSGSGTLSALTAPAPAAAVALSGSGVLSDVVTPRPAVTIGLGGSGALTSTATPAAASTVGLSGSGTLSAVVTPKPVASVSLAGSGALTSSATTATSSTVPLFGSGSLGTISSVAVPRTVALTGSGTLGTTVTAASSSSVNLTGSGALTASLSGMSATTTAPLSGSGSLLAAAAGNGSSAPALAGLGSLAATGTPAPQLTVGLSGAGALTAAGTPTAKPSVTLSGLGALTSTSAATPATNVALTGAGALSAAAAGNGASSPALSGSGVLTSSATITAPARSEMVADPSMEVTTNPRWTYGGKFVHDTAQVHSGTYSIRIDPPALVAGGTSQSIQVPFVNGTGSIPCTPGDVWQFAAWCYTSPDFDGTANNSKFRLAKGDGTLLTVSTWAGNPGTWALRTITYTVAAGVTSLSASLVADHATGGLWIDDVSAQVLAPASGSGPVALLGSGTLFSSVTPKPTASLGLSGSGALTASVTAAATSSVTLAGSGALATTATITSSSGATLTGSGALLAVAAGNGAASPALSGSGALTPSVLASVASTVSLAGSGVLTATSKATPAATPNLTGSGALTASSSLASATTATLTGVGTVTAAAAGNGASAPSLTGTGALSTVTSLAISNPVNVGRRGDIAGTGWGGTAVSQTRGLTDPWGGTTAFSAAYNSAGNQYIAPSGYTFADGLITGHMYTFVMWVKSGDGTTFSLNVSGEDFSDSGSFSPSGQWGYPVETITPTWTRFTRTVTVGSAPAAKPLLYSLSGIANGHTVVAAFEGVYDLTAAVQLGGSGSLATASFGTRTNWATNPHATSVAGGWTNQTPASSVVGYDPTGAQDGGSAYFVTTTASGQMRIKAPTTGSQVLTPNGTATVGMDLYIPEAGQTGHMEVAFNTSGGIVYVQGPVVPMPQGWSRLVQTVAVPATSTGSFNLAQYLGGTSATAGFTYKASRVTVETGNSSGTYFDGSTTSPEASVGSASWTGTANNSVSTELVPTANAAAGSSVTLAGSGALTAAVLASTAGSAALSGSGAMTITATPSAARIVALSGSGALTGSNSISVPSVVALSGSGTVTASVSPIATATPALSGSGALTDTATPAVTRSVTLSGSGVLSAASSLALTASVDLSGAGALSSTSSAKPFTSVSLSGSGAINPIGSSITAGASVGFSGAGSLLLVSGPNWRGTVSFSGSGGLVGESSSNSQFYAPLGGSGLLQVVGKARDHNIFGILYLHGNPISVAGRLAGETVVLHGKKLTVTGALSGQAVTHHRNPIRATLG